MSEGRKEYRKPPQILILPGDWREERPPLNPDKQRCYCRRRLLFVLVGDELIEGKWWRHWSASRPDDVPSYADLACIKRDLVGAKGRAYQVFPPDEEHVDIHPRVLHLWQPLDHNPLPDFRENFGEGVYGI